MSGVGRRTPYRKHLQDRVLYDRPEPGEDERIAKVVSTRGSNQFDVVLAEQSSGEPDESHHRPSHLAILPTKFHKLVWIKRNDFVIVQTVSDDKNELQQQLPNGAPPAKASSGGIRYMVVHVLYKDQVKHLQARKLWPTQDAEFSTTNNVTDASSNDPRAGGGKEELAVENEESVDPSDGIVYDQEHDNERFFEMQNPNQRRLQRRKDSEDSSEESEEEYG